MIRVIIKRDNLKHIVGYGIMGHAGFDEYGKDIVCAAVSILAQSTLTGLAEVAGIDVRYSIDESKGSLYCDLPSLNEDDREKADLLLNTMYNGLKSIRDSYPGNLSIKEEEV